MATRGKEFLKVSLVLLDISLLQHNEDIGRFRDLVDADVVATGVGFAPAPSADAPIDFQNLSISRDRITIESARERSVLSREYPIREDIARFAEVAQHALAVTDPDSAERGAGYNVELLYDQDSGVPAAEYLSQRLFKELSQEDRWKISRGHGSVSFFDGKDIWNCSVEPRFRDPETTRLYLSVNRHRVDPSPPSKADIEERLKGSWDWAIEFAEKLDGQP